MQDVMGTIGDYDSGFYIGMISHYHKMKNKSVPFFLVAKNLKKMYEI
jgi:hypothetical protein